MKSRGCFADNEQGWKEYNKQFTDQPEEIKIREDELVKNLDDAIDFTMMEFVRHDSYDYSYIFEDDFDNFKKELVERILSYLKGE